MEVNPAVGPRGEVEVVGDDDEGHSAGSANLEKQLDDSPPGVFVQVSGRFVGQDYAGFVEEGARDGDSLLFAAAQLPWLVSNPIR